jgi:acetyl-CoA C-acetyltransferase
VFSSFADRLAGGLKVSGSIIVSGVRTPIGKLGGGLASLSAVELCGRAISEAMRRISLNPEDVDFVAIGQVLQAGQGQNPARQAAVLAGLPMTVQAVTVNKVCLSGLEAIHLADLLISAGEADLVIAGGMESMSRAPYLLEGARTGLGFGHASLRDAMVVDGLTDAFLDLAMGAATDRDAAAAAIGREAQDAVALRSHRRASVAIKDGRLADEIVPIAAPQRRGEDVLVTDDEGVRPGTTAAALATLKPAFGDDGTITAGNASQLSDGAAVVVASRRAAEKLGTAPLAEVVAFGRAAGPSLLVQPAHAIVDALGRCGLKLSDRDVIEVNGAFAAVVVASAHELGVPVEMLNPNGGARSPLVTRSVCPGAGSHLRSRSRSSSATAAAAPGWRRCAGAEGSATRSFFEPGCEYGADPNMPGPGPPALRPTSTRARVPFRAAATRSIL